MLKKCPRYTIILGIWVMIVFVLFTAMLIYGGLSNSLFEAGIADYSSFKQVGLSEEVGKIEINVKNGDEGKVTLSFAKPCVASNFEMFADYANKHLYLLCFEKTGKDQALNILADSSKVSAVSYMEKADGIVYDIEFLDYFNATMQVDGYNIVFDIQGANESDKPVIVFDVMGESCFRQSIISMVVNILGNEKYTIYDINWKESNLDNEKIVDFVNSCDADIFISLDVGGSEDDEEAATVAYCNDIYFMPQLDSVTLADMLEREIVTAIGGEAGGVLPCESDEVLMLLEIPCARLDLGYCKDVYGNLNIDLPEYPKYVANAINKCIDSIYK